MEEVISMESIKQIVFELGGEYYSIEISKVQGIEPRQNIIRVPNAPNCIMGIINLRGDVIPVYSLRKKFGNNGREADEEKLIITRSQDVVIAFQVDSVSEIIEIENSKMFEPPVIIK